MEKILSIIIPTYNMAALLPRCLDSLTASGVLDDLDILVVNDGSTDSSRAVAYSYAERYPQSIKVVDKKNGNYGSTINAALPLAVGEYVKVLDSDDWFDSQALAKYVAELKSLEQEVDVSVTHFLMIHEGGRTETVKYQNYGREPYTYGKVYNLDKVLGDGFIRYFLMHSLTYRTQLLRDHGYRQTEGISYTDIQWSSYPFFWAGSIVFHDLVVYRYNMDREGQTMDPAVIRKSLPQLERMTMDLMDFYRKADMSDLSEARVGFLRQYFKNRLRLLVKTHLMDIPRREFDKEAFSSLDSWIQAVLTEFRMGRIRVFPENKVIRIDAYRYWHRHRDRLPVWIEGLNHLVDPIARRIFVLLFH
ncbi:MAG: glycosyltransferase family A protein [Bacteroidales bacterium]|nr:glycosyltransferase family A protein [Bacteroidales bacterium]MDD6828516.1 glycosyltransferase family A protein [Bacteroidales bacterium]